MRLFDKHKQTNDEVRHYHCQTYVHRVLRAVNNNLLRLCTKWRQNFASHFYTISLHL